MSLIPNILCKSKVLGAQPRAFLQGPSFYRLFVGVIALYTLKYFPYLNSFFFWHDAFYLCGLDLKQFSVFNCFQNIQLIT